MKAQDCKVGMKVYFGRDNGQKTLAEVVKCNNVKAKVKTLEQRGYGKGSEIGSVWVVPYDLLTATTQLDDIKVLDAMSTPSRFDPPIESPIFAFAHEDIKILEAISAVYAALSPENLHCDGEISASQANQKRIILNRKLQGLFTAYGRTVSETAILEWEKSLKVVG